MAFGSVIYGAFEESQLEVVAMNQGFIIKE
jgi:hypothetical protein